MKRDLNIPYHLHNSSLYIIKKNVQVCTSIGETTPIKVGSLVAYEGLYDANFVPSSYHNASYVAVRIYMGDKLFERGFMERDLFGETTIHVVLAMTLDTMKVTNTIMNKDSIHEEDGIIERAKTVAVATEHYDKVTMFRISDKSPLTVQTYRVDPTKNIPLLILNV